HDGEQVQPGVCPDLAQNLLAVDARHLEVEEHHGGVASGPVRLRTAAQEIIERLDAIARHHDLIGKMRLAQGGHAEFDIERVVFDEQDGAKIGRVRHGQKGGLEFTPASGGGVVGNVKEKVAPAPGLPSA